MRNGVRPGSLLRIISWSHSVAAGGTPEASAKNAVESTYVLNTGTRKFRLPTCGSVSKVKESNRQTFTGTRQELVDQGYAPCGKCNP